mmetsp:Transcript_14244/g.40883  ORF Transcript_14244/g.40883 Transcript_14244/m.40883 type:complete len:295 (+) Transcript_14244:690-1574(+)
MPPAPTTGPRSRVRPASASTPPAATDARFDRARYGATTGSSMRLAPSSRRFGRIGRRGSRWWCHLRPSLARRHRPTPSVEVRRHLLWIVPLGRANCAGLGRCKEGIRRRVQDLIGSVEHVVGISISAEITARRRIRSGAPLLPASRSGGGGRSGSGHPFPGQSLPPGITGGGALVLLDLDLIEGRWSGGRVGGRRRSILLSFAVEHLRSRTWTRRSKRPKVVGVNIVVMLLLLLLLMRLSLVLGDRWYLGVEWSRRRSSLVWTMAAVASDLIENLGAGSRSTCVGMDAPRSTHR